MVKSRRILSTVLAIVMVLTMIPMCSFGTVGAVDDVTINTATIVDTGNGKLVTPVVTLKSTPVFRVASSSNVFLGGTTLVNATDSGLPGITGDYTSQFYAGEDPHGYEVVFTSDKVLAGTPSLGCSVPNIGISEPVKSGNTYTWTISAGSSTINAGDSIRFTVGYSYSYTDSLSGKTVTKNYKAYTSSHAENVTSGAGMYLYRTRKKTHLHENEHMGFLYRILGANTYASFTGGSTAYDVGYYDFASNSWAGNGSATGMHYKDGTKDSSTGNEYYSTGLDRRALATTYIDRNGTDGAPLSKNNMRFSFYEALNRSDYKRYVRGLFVFEGLATFGEDDYSGSNTALTQLGLPEVTETEVAGHSETHYNMNGSTYDSAATEADNGNLVSNYTVIGNAGTYYTTTERVCNSRVAVSLTINSYDKSELNGLVNELVNSENNDPSSPDKTSGIGINPQVNTDTNWYSEGSSAYLTALQAAQDILAKPDTNQNEIDSAYTNLDNAVKGLVVANADVTALNIALNAYLAKNSSEYTPASWQVAKEKYEAAVATKEYSVFYQCAVDKATDDLNAALEALKYNLADWDAAEELYEAYEELDATLYTPESWAVLKNAVEYCQQEQAKGTYYVPQQDAVNEIIAAIGKAIDDLDDALADYSEYDALVAKYNNEVVPTKLAIEKNLADNGIDLAALGITNIYTETSWKSVTSKLNLERDYKWYEQEDVDDAADDLEYALSKLTLVSAVYTGVNAAIADANKLTKSWYTTESWAALDAALKAVNKTYKIDKQVEVNAMEANIRDAMSKLVEANANYAQFEEYQTKAEALNPSYYAEEAYNNLFILIDSVNQNYKAKDQATLNAEVALVIQAYNALEKLPADYTAVETAKTRWNNVENKGNYTDASVAAVTKAIGDVVTGKKIDEQDAVNAMAKAINDAIDALELKLADYTALEAAFADAKAAVKTQSDYAQAHNGYKYYTTATYSNLETVLGTIPVNADGTLKKDKKITDQATVTGYATTLSGAVTGLALNKADYSALVAALQTVPSDDDLEKLYTTETASNVVIAAINGQGAVDADEYTVAQQNEVDALTKAVTDAVAALIEKELDLTTYNAAVNRIPEDLTKYTTESVDAMNSAKTAADNFKTTNNKISKQTEFEVLVKAFDDSITALVENAPESFEFVSGAKTTTKSGVKYVYGLKAGLSKTKLKGYISNENTTYTVKTANGSNVGTGSTITVFNSKGEQIDQFVVIIYGDVDGNAKITADDYNMVVDALSGEGESLAGAAKYAANVSGSTSTINSQDYDLIADVAAGMAEINQAKAVK